jgi:hypothetical protein
MLRVCVLLGFGLWFGMIRYDSCVCRTFVDEEAEDEMEQRRCNAER